jgi:hypothetical protein
VEKQKDAPELPLANWLEIRQGHGAAHSGWHRQAFRELTELIARKIFGQDLSEIEDEHGEIFGIPGTADPDNLSCLDRSCNWVESFVGPLCRRFG